MQGLLEGFGGLDLAREIAGPYCGMLLGDMGAEGAKAERCGKWDDVRIVYQQVAGESLYYFVMDRNKQGVTAYLRDPRGQSLLRDLDRQVDVLIENSRAGTIEKMGCSWADEQSFRRLVVIIPLLFLAVSVRKC
jgi:crotonobetainyl-CoA:carnitine CoA-transferase CaiB-like acyl-CoA transferase